MNRRTFLGSLGATTSTLLAGCITPIENLLNNSVQLGWLGAHNWDTKPHKFDLRVERDGSQVHNSSHEIPPREGNHINGAVAECTWGSTPGEYVVYARLDNGEWVDRSLTEFVSSMDSDVDCVIADAWFRDGKLSLELRLGCDIVYDGMCPFVS